MKHTWHYHTSRLRSRSLQWKDSKQCPMQCARYIRCCICTLMQISARHSHHPKNSGYRWCRMIWHAFCSFPSADAEDPEDGCNAFEMDYGVRRSGDAEVRGWKRTANKDIDDRRSILNCDCEYYLWLNCLWGFLVSHTLDQRKVSPSKIWALWHLGVDYGFLGLRDRRYPVLMNYGFTVWNSMHDDREWHYPVQHTWEKYI